MRRRWLAPWKDSVERPVVYHCVSRIVDRRFVLDEREREHFRMLMRMMENFTGCRVLSYCIMSNHIHLLLEVPPLPAGGISDEELLRRLGGLYGKGSARVAEVAKELAEARQMVAAGVAREEVVVARIHERYTRRMHDLSEFMKTLLQRFTRWFNRMHERSGVLWEERFKSVLVESGVASRTMAAYIDLNPVRAGMVEDPAEYRWSSYGEAIGGGAQGDGKKARQGLVRAYLAHEGVGFEAERWREVGEKYRQLLGMALQRRKGKAEVPQIRHESQRRSQTAATGGAAAGPEGTGLLPEMGMAGMLRHRVRYFTDGAVIGCRAFVDEVFVRTRERFSAKRRDGARKLRGHGQPAAAVLWSARDLRVRL